MKTVSTYALAFLIIGAEALGAEIRENEYVRVEAALSKQTVMPGDKIDLQVNFKPAEGIHITADPEVKIGVRPSRFVWLRGKHSQVLDSSSGYLSIEEPVIQPIRISPAASPGKHTLHADVTYYFCSDEARWCRKFVQTVELHLTLKDGRLKPSR